MNLPEDEVIITTSNDNAVILTTHSIRSDFGAGSETKLTSIMLEHVSSVQLSSRTYPVLIGIALLCIIGGVAAGSDRFNSSFPAVLIVMGAAFGIAYFFFKQHTCAITSAGGVKIEFSTTSMKREALIAFLDKTEEAVSKKKVIFDQASPQL
jgi:hypothetical protein